MVVMACPNATRAVLAALKVAALTSFDGFRREWNLRWPDFALDWGEPERPCGADFDPWSACERESV